MKERRNSAHIAHDDEDDDQREKRSRENSPSQQHTSAHLHFSRFRHKMQYERNASSIIDMMLYCSRHKNRVHFSNEWNKLYMFDGNIVNSRSGKESIAFNFWVDQDHFNHSFYLYYILKYPTMMIWCISYAKIDKKWWRQRQHWLLWSEKRSKHVSDERQFIVKETHSQAIRLIH